jgi:hypothetical protein
MSDRTLSRIFAVVLVFLGGAVCGNCWGAILHADDQLPPIRIDAEPPSIEVAEPEPELDELAPEPVAVPPADATPTPDERLAALLLARYAGHEADLERRGDLLLIWQAAESHGETLEERVDWLRRHSRCVVADPPRVRPGRRCRRFRGMGWAAVEPPDWPASVPWRRAEPDWRAYLELALDVVTGRETRRPCDAPIDTWDGRHWLDQRLEEGYREITCRDPWTGELTANAGFRFPHWREARDRAARAAPSPPPGLEEVRPMVATSSPEERLRGF